MSIEVLVATMHQSDFTLLKKMNICSRAIIINQCDRNEFHEFVYNGHNVIWIDTNQRGLSRSRNMALSYATQDIVLLADDDEVLYDEYPSVIERAFHECAQADIIAFNIDRTNKRSTRKQNVNRPAPMFRYYPSVSIAIRRIKILKHGIHFNELIGAGSGYGSGEEALLLIDSRRNGLKVYENKHTICLVDFSSSSWFNGYNDNYYFNTGVFLRAGYKRMALLFGLYYLLQSRNKSKLSLCSVWTNITRGIAHYDEL